LAGKLGALAVTGEEKQGEKEGKGEDEIT